MFDWDEKEKLRREKYLLLCKNQNLQFADSDDFGTIEYLKGFELFNSGMGEIRNLCQKKSSSLDTEINLFDYKYSIYTGKTNVSTDQTVFFANSKKLGLPQFAMKPENFGHKIAAFFGWEDVDFESYPVFSDAYHLTGEDEDFIRHSFNDQVLKFFSKTSGWTIEAANYYMIFYAFNTLVPDHILPDFYRLGLGITNLFENPS